MSITKKYLKRVLGVVAVAVIILIVWNFELITYGIAQARGQFSILWQAREINEVLEDPGVSMEVKEKLLLIGKVREYAMQRLGLRYSDNYTTFLIRKGNPFSGWLPPVNPTA